MQTATYHQSSNGQAEGYIKTVIKHSLESNSNKIKALQEKLLDSLDSYRSKPHTAATRTPSEKCLLVEI